MKTPNSKRGFPKAINGPRGGEKSASNDVAEASRLDIPGTKDPTQS
jgi:hypothetical protein